MDKENLFGKTLAELKVIINTLSLPAYTAAQISDWLYKKEVNSIIEMTNISLSNREKLSEKYFIGLTNSKSVTESIDGTKKYLFTTLNNNYIESAYIPDEKRNTLCVSTQAGCKMGCLFCMTGKQGFQSNLTTGEILNQVKSIPEFHKLTNIVYMGMGEPLDNYANVIKSLEILTSDWGFAMSPKRITVSTIGILPAMQDFLRDSNCHLAVSMHSPFDSERKYLMPVQSVFPIVDVIEMIRDWDFGRQRRVSFEYIMFKGLNDTRKHADEIIRILNGIKCRINLIRFHPIPDTPLSGTSNSDIENFRDYLSKKGVTTTIRKSRGEDIYAACGLLSTKELQKKKQE